jgi:hypothetical protein
MTEFLQPLKMGLPKKKGIPLAMEFEVDPRTAPYLVTSMDSVLWVPEALNGKIVRAAVRRQVRKPHGIYQELLQAIEDMGREAEWGNVHPKTVKGLEEAIAHVEHYEIPGGLEIVCPIDREKVKRTLRDKPEFENLTIREAEWVPPGKIVVLPRDRNYVGFIMRLGSGNVLAVVHNGSRGVGICSK